jgi:hypothetical protein
MGTGSSPGVSGRGVALTTHPHLVPLWAFVAYSRVNFTFTFIHAAIYGMAPHDIHKEEEKQWLLVLLL